MAFIHAVLAIVNVPFVTAYFTKSVPRQIVDRGRRGIPRSNIRWPTGHSEGAATGGAHGSSVGLLPKLPRGVTVRFVCAAVLLLPSPGIAVVRVIFGWRTPHQPLARLKISECKVISLSSLVVADVISDATTEQQNQRQPEKETNFVTNTHSSKCSLDVKPSSPVVTSAVPG